MMYVPPYLVHTVLSSLSHLSPTALFCSNLAQPSFLSPVKWMRRNGDHIRYLRFVNIYSERCHDKKNRSRLLLRKLFNLSSWELTKDYVRQLDKPVQRLKLRSIYSEAFQTLVSRSSYHFTSTSWRNNNVIIHNRRAVT